MSLTATLKKVEEERNELKAANEAMEAAHAEKISELEGAVAERDSKVGVALKELADCVGELEKRNAKIADLEKQAGELAEQVKTEKAAREKAEQALADPSFAISDGAEPVSDGGEAGEIQKSLSEQLAAIEDPAEKNKFYKANKDAIKAESRKA